MENIMSFHFHSLLFLHFCFMACLAMTVRNLTTDQSSLLAFKSYITSDPHSVLTHNWSISNPVCTWVGISCSARHSRVTTLDLSGMDLGGTISAHLANLSFLAYLNIQDNNFQGHLPMELSQMRRLKVINFSNNDLHGGFPSWIGNLSKLQVLDFTNNSITGTIPHSLFDLSELEIILSSYNMIEGNIPSEIGRLSNLKELHLGSNLLSGSLPLTIYNVSSLEIIVLPYNNLSSSLPSDICNRLPKLAFLYLNNNEFFGNLPPSWDDCSELRHLSLWNNKFTGRLPENIGNMSKLINLDLDENNLEGPIPSTIFNISSLKVFRAANNSLSGSLPEDLCHHLPAFELLFLRGNKITGTIPKNIGNCTLLKYLYLPINHLTGEIPHELGNLHNLEELDLSDNSLTGHISPKIFNMSNIKIIAVSQNKLSGCLPSNIGWWLPNLEELYLGKNKFSGPIPNSISNASKLIHIELGFNSFTGLIPKTLGNLRFLSYLNLGYNNFTTESSTTKSSFLSSLTNCRNIKYLIFDSNPLYSFLLSSIGNISTSLQILSANGCKLRGNIPKEIGNLHNLIYLRLANNELNGSMPTMVGKLLNLQALVLPNNNLQGSIPYGICHLQRLYTLQLFDNKLSGHIPTCLESLNSLRKLDLSSNKLTSNLPYSVWTLNYILYINLSSNSLSGSIPSVIQNLKVLIQLDLSGNQLSGNIPITIGALEDLVILSLADNKFEGSIPNSFGALTSLESLDLSNNSLSGKIPKSMEKLLYLREFNVSYNLLEGEIPNGGPFKNFSSLSFMWNHALCGSPRLKVPYCKKAGIKRSKPTILLVLKFLLPLAMSTIIVVIIFIRYQNRSSNCLAQEELLPLTTWRRTSYLEIQQATDGFSECNLLGTGSFGSVYKGTFLDGTNVAIKLFNLHLERAYGSFDSECEVLRNIRHRNLIKILSCCCNNEFKALVLEFMPNGSLEKWLYSHNYFLDILQRLNIMIDVASALEYLHHNYSTPIVHCDLKPSNILLDENMVAHVSDFGIAKLLSESDSMTRTMTMATIGYMAPEYGSMGIVSTRGDVYSYGILLMETFTRKKPTDEMFAGEISLKYLVESSLPHVVTEVVDVNLLQDQNGFAVKVNCISSIMDLALHCSMESPEQRINMKDALAKLKKIKMQFLKDVGASK